MGKGIRTSARDAILSSETTNENKGKVFGFHRAADTLGAAIGPTLAIIFLSYYPVSYHYLFYLSSIPAIIGVTITFLIKEKNFPKKEDQSYSFFAFLKYWKISTKEYRHIVIVLLIFALINSSDMFLLLIAKYKGLSDIDIIKGYIFYNLIYAVFSAPLGILGDKIGLKNTFAIGMLFFGLTYLGFSVSSSMFQFFIMFFLYGIYSAGTEGISKAWLSNNAKKDETATAIGFYNSWQSLLTFISSSLAGVIWLTAGASLPFIISGVVAMILFFYLILKKNLN